MNGVLVSRFTHKDGSTTVRLEHPDLPGQGVLILADPGEDTQERERAVALQLHEVLWDIL